MELNDYQTHARKTAVNDDLNHFAFGLLEEAGEVAGVMKRFHRGDVEYGVWTKDAGTQLSPFAEEKLKAELGDLLWYIALMADHLSITLDEVAKYNLAKLQRRKAKDMIHGSGDDR